MEREGKADEGCYPAIGGAMGLWGTGVGGGGGADLSPKMILDAALPVRW